ncbi:glycosyltransferase [Streptomyces sp. NPDC056222]|uniref:glycosyltransferase n=1 Tax=Streptomyces sp. NPDC056222 TaxID=3345749 RepID=UPI0035D5F9B5
MVIGVDDGSTADLVRAVAAADRRIRLLTSERDRGKGRALCIGVLASPSSRVLLFDADQTTDASLGEQHAWRELRRRQSFRRICAEHTVAEYEQWQALQRFTTVEVHLTCIYRKLHLRSQADLMRLPTATDPRD